MSKLICHHCDRPIAAPVDASAVSVPCPHCRRDVQPGDAPATRWFVAHGKQRYGPYTWQRLVTLALRGDLDPNVMLLKEKSTRWVRAGTVRELFATPPPMEPAPAVDPPPVPPLARRDVRATPPVESAAAAEPKPVSPPAKEPDIAATPHASMPAKPPPAPVVTQELHALLAYINALDATLKPPAPVLPDTPPTSAIAPAPAPAPAALVAAAPTLDLPAVHAPDTDGGAVWGMIESAASPTVMHASLAPLDAPEPVTLAVEPVAATVVQAESEPRFDRTEPGRAAAEPVACVSANPQLNPAEWNNDAVEPIVYVSAATTPPQALPAPVERRRIPWLVEGLSAASVSVLIAACFILGFFVIEWRGPPARQAANPNGVIETTEKSPDRTVTPAGVARPDQPDSQGARRNRVDPRAVPPAEHPGAVSHSHDGTSH